ncbi:hypothetical protein [Nocardioides sp. Soil805]|uniref:hypothetical protein n=1 Tax=Nocardioides sp. Soil805 TaxID=1736416 RepID=UPI00070292D3|nr:hypothetical protein [Nocardioides sp. Soil805]KRF34878.1 hypothetical protein ASG94_12025 [Nocardioides sp. Soil805]
MTDLPPEDPAVLDPDDQQVLDELAEALSSHRDVEPRHREAARSAFTWRTVDSELMELTYDSLDAPVTVRSAIDALPRALSFASGFGTLDVELDGDRVRGHIVPAAVATVVMSNAAGATLGTESDEDGMFDFPGSLPGPVRFSIEGEGAGTTPWVTL